MIKIDGINTHVPNKTWLQKAQALGIRWARIDINWNTTEPKSGQYAFGPIDTAITEAKKMGLKVYASIAYTPAWAAAKKTDTPPVQYWTRFVTKVAQRYGAKIDVYGMWNEPNLKAFYTGTLNEYKNVIMIPGYQAVKNVNPALQVAAGELSSASHSNWPEWTELLYKNHTVMDVVGFHSYQDSAAAIKNRFNVGKAWIFGWIIPYYRPYNHYLDKLRKKGKKIFLSEVGWKAKAGNSKEEKAQKENIEKLMKYKKDIKVDEIFIYDLHDDVHFPNDPWGVYDPNGNPKQSAK